jgi:hypothetical protein
MQDMWTALEERSRSWRALDRQALADGIWADYVTVRFSGTGDAQALQFLYPYLNHAEKGGKRTGAIAVAARVFRGCGPRAIGELDYLTRNTDAFLRDRAVHVVGAAVAVQVLMLLVATVPLACQVIPTRRTMPLEDTAVQGTSVSMAAQQAVRQELYRLQMLITRLALMPLLEEGAVAVRVGTAVDAAAATVVVAEVAEVWVVMVARMWSS